MIYAALSLALLGLIQVNGQSCTNMQCKVTSLPGLDPSIASQYTMYSGYINVDSSSPRYIFYFFIESLNDPVNDPVAFWTNGGPGCSGLGGMWTEQGPFRVMENQTVVVNPTSWVNVANMIFVEQPAGVGFSYCQNPSDLKTGDDKAAMDNYHFIQGWLNTFPSFKTNDFYTTSESYGGHYMPTLAKAIVQGNAAGGSPQINYKGLFVGNPYTDPVENSIGQYDTWYGHQLVPYPVWQEWYQKCADGSKSDLGCYEAEAAMSNSIGGDIDPYGLDFPICQNKLMASKHENRYWFLKHVVRDTLGRPLPPKYEAMAQEHDKYDEDRNRRRLSGEFPPPDYQACASAYSTEWLNRKDVQTAIHVSGNWTKGIWTDCGGVDYNYSNSANPMEPYYTWLIDNSDIRITVVSGDDDSVCGSLGTQSWIFYNGYSPKHESNWVAWYLDNQVAGYLTEFETNTNATMKFVTVHGAGHMIPQQQGARSLQSFTNYLSGMF